jgi:hypothetical protein
MRMLTSYQDNAGKNDNIKRANRSSENVAQLKYFRTRVKNKNLNQEEIKRRLNSGFSCYHPVQNICLLVRCLKT